MDLDIRAATPADLVAVLEPIDASGLTVTAGDFFSKFGFRKIERGDVDPAAQASQEFASACPASAMVMAKQI